jgi:hypothetical protein
MDLEDNDAVQISSQRNRMSQGSGQQLEEIDHFNEDHRRSSAYEDLEDADAENEVSINLEDAIATAEEMNSHKQIVDGLDDFSGDLEDDEEIANEIAGIVTDGHNVPDDDLEELRE